MARVLSAFVLLPLVIAAVWFLGPVGLLVVAETVLVLALVEFARLAEALGAPVPRVPTAVAAGALCAAIALPDAPVDVAVMAGTLGLAALGLGAGRPDPGWPARVFAAVFAMAYLGLPLGALVALRVFAGREMVLLLLLTVVVSDTAQFYTGRLLGRTPLAPAISPKKTVEGAVGGLVAGPVAMALGGLWWQPDVAAASMAGLGLAVVSLGILGDLFESLLKRSAGLKDSSGLIPGHGGVLDRIDALLFAAPACYVAVRYGLL